MERVTGIEPAPSAWEACGPALGVLSRLTVRSPPRDQPSSLVTKRSVCPLVSPAVRFVASEP